MKISEKDENQKPQGVRSFFCIVCKGSKKHNDVYSLEGKKCFEDDFIIKFMKLVTKRFYDKVCDSFKSLSNKNYVCRSCFMIVINTYESIVRLQAGVAQSIKKRLSALQTSHCDKGKGLEDDFDFHPIDIRRKKNSTKTELGRQEIESLKLVSINKKHPKIPLQCVLSNFNKPVHENSEMIDNERISYCSSSLSSMNPERNAIGNSYGLESLLVAARVVEADHISSYHLDKFAFQRNKALLSNRKNSEKKMNTSSKPGPLSWKQRKKQLVLPENIIKHDLWQLEKRNETRRVRRIINLNKAGPLSWKQRTNKYILPDNIEALDPKQAKNLIVKKRMPIRLPHVKDKNIFMCTQPNCEWVFLSEYSLNNHTKHFHKDSKPHKCLHVGCVKTFAQKGKLKKHILSHLGEKPHVCSTCGKAFSQSVNLKYHMVSHTDKADVKDYKCPRPDCNRSYKYAVSLKRHLNFHDGGELPFPCSYPGCEKAYKNAYELKCHFRHHTGEKPYKCDEPGCGKSFRLPGQYTVHRRNHQGERPFKCSWEGCDAAYSNRGQLETHSLSHKGKTFICDLCGKTFTYKIAMLVHRKKMHTEERDFKCQIEGCEKAFHFRFELNAHITKFHNAKHIGKKRRVLRGTKKVFLVYPCPVHECTKEYASKSNIEKHLLLFHGLMDAKLEPKSRADLLVCPVEGCGAQFLTQRNLRYHKISVHNSLSVRFRKTYGGKRFSCTFEGCQRVYETMTALRQHVGRMHISVPTEKMCFNCGAPFRHIQQLEVHRQVMHGEESVLNEQKCGIYICKAEKCGMNFLNAEDLKQHVHVHIESPPYKCTFQGCRSNFLTEKNYNNHILNHNKKKPHQCSFEGCEQKFGTQFQLLKHSIEHYGNYKCPVEKCGRMLISLNSARVHLFRHSGEKPHKCSVCGVAFAVSSNLLRHMRTHTGEKPFECKICLKRFADKAVLITHIRRHTGEKPYICNVCGSCFSSLASIKIHMRLHTGETPYACKEEGCDKRFRDLSSLKSHKNVHSKAGQLCSQCGKVFRWGVKKHKCKSVSETAAIASTSASDVGSKKSRQIHYQQQPPKLQLTQHQERQSQLKQGSLQHLQQLQPLSVLLQQQQQQQPQHQESTHLLQIQPPLIQLQQPKSLPDLPVRTSEQPHQQTSIAQHQEQSMTQQQQHSLALIHALQQPLQFHQPQQLQPQAQLQVPLQHTNTHQAGPQTPYSLGNMVITQDQVHRGISYTLENNNAEPNQTVKPEDASTNALIMHDLDSNYQIVYEKSVYTQ